MKRYPSYQSYGTLYDQYGKIIIPELKEVKEVESKPLPPITDEERLLMTPEQENQENNYQDFI